MPTVNDLRKLLHANTQEIADRRNMGYSYTRRMCRRDISERSDYLQVFLDMAEERTRDLAKAFLILEGERSRILDLHGTQKLQIRRIRRGLKRFLDIYKSEETDHANDRDRPIQT